MGLVLALLFAHERRAAAHAEPHVQSAVQRVERLPASGWLHDRVLVLGQTALLFYVLHIPLLEGVARLAGWSHAIGREQPQIGAASAWLGAAAVLLVLYPVCAWYRAYERRHRNLLTALL